MPLGASGAARGQRARGRGQPAARPGPLPGTRAGHCSARPLPVTRRGIFSAGPGRAHEDLGPCGEPPAAGPTAAQGRRRLLPRAASGVHADRQAEAT
jgi:hypothetical protein